MYTFAIHVVDGISTATTNTNHLDDAIFFFRFPKVKNMRSVSII
ncbi:Uncharacterised protein [Segatella copri]|nr:Uncharacterised protein [Segatella copri]